MSFKSNLKKLANKEFYQQNKLQVGLFATLIGSIPLYFILRKKEVILTKSERDFLIKPTKIEANREKLIGLTIETNERVSSHLDIELNNILEGHDRKVAWKPKMQDDYFSKNKILSIKSDIVKDLVEGAFNIHNLYLDAIDNIVNDPLTLSKFGVTDDKLGELKESWNLKKGDFIGRMEFIWDGKNKPKLIEYVPENFEYFVESSRAQSLVVNNFANVFDVKSLNSFNYLEDSFILFWRKFHQKNPELSNIYISNNLQYSSYLKNLMTVNKFGNQLNKELLSDLQTQSNGLSLSNENLFYFKLNSEGQLKPVEPSWKSLFSNKLFLVHLWNNNLDHPNLVKTSTHSFVGSVSKKNSNTNEKVFQEKVNSVEIKGRTFNFYVWIVMGLPVCIGVRALNDNKFIFIPHYHSNFYEDITFNSSQKISQIRKQLYGEQDTNILQIFNRRSKNIFSNQI